MAELKRLTGSAEACGLDSGCGEGKGRAGGMVTNMGT